MNASDYEYLHEAEEVLLRAKPCRSARELWRLLPKIGFQLDDDVFTLPRTDRGRPRWQSDAIAYVTVLRGDEELYEDDGEWDVVRLDYHLATLPRHFIWPFSASAAELAAHLNLPLEFRGAEVSPEQLRVRLMEYAEEVAAHFGEPGSKDVRMFIEATYPR